MSSEAPRWPEVARRSDPRTSHVAAKGSQPRTSVRRIIEAEFMRCRSLADFELCDRVAELVPRSCHCGVLAKRRSELVDAGVLEDSKRTKVNPWTGNRCKVWQVVTPPSAEPVSLFESPPDPGRFAR